MAITYTNLHQNVLKSTGNDFTDYIQKNAPLVFTRENIDPYVCGTAPTRCGTKVSEVYAVANAPMEANGRSCSDVTECNNPAFN